MQFALIALSAMRIPLLSMTGMRPLPPGIIWHATTSDPAGPYARLIVCPELSNTSISRQLTDRLAIISTYAAVVTGVVA